APPHGPAAASEQAAATVSFPLRSSIAQASGSDQELLTVFVENPLTTALQAAIAQPIPDGMAVVDAGGGSVVDGRIEWAQTLGPGQPALFTAALQPMQAGTGGMLPGAQLTFTDPDTAEAAQFGVPDRTLPPPIAADLDAAIPDSAAASGPIDIAVQLHSRQSSSALSGTLQLELRALDESVLARIDQPIGLAPGADSQLTLSLSAPATPGSYMVVGTLAGVPGAPRGFAGLVEVQASAPAPQPAITFVSHRDGNDEIYRMNPDGGNQQRLTNSASAEGWPGMSADARQITFWSARDGNNEIYVMDADGANQRRLTFNSANDEAPAWSPDGRSIAFMSARDGNNEIYVMDADGANQRRLTFNSADDNAPVWSPDGGSIAFRSRRDGNDEIYVMDANGGNQRRLTFNSADDRAPAWSPDSGSIAFHSRRDGNWEIYVMDANGANPRRLTTGAASDQTPTWSPDGRQIAFMSDRDGNQEIYVMDASGASQQRLTFTAANDHSPGWWSR
ncbi:MAG TPA: DPP IV N-terminal domain-containing protein, partial [Kouleothrix sp.]|nr:DPP IV N-terminal domain-containing protein [Kouleothrix sp.]